MENSLGLGGVNMTLASLANAARGYRASIKSSFISKKTTGSVFKFCTDDPLRRQSHSITVERQGTFQIVYAECDHLNSRLHIMLSTGCVRLPNGSRLRCGRLARRAQYS